MLEMPCTTPPQMPCATSTSGMFDDRNRRPLTPNRTHRVTKCHTRADGMRFELLQAETIKKKGEKIMFFLDSINFFGGVSSAIQAALLLIVGLVAAAIARFVIKKIVLRVIDSRAKKAGGNAPAESDSDTKKNIRI